MASQDVMSAAMRECETRAISKSILLSRAGVGRRDRRAWVVASLRRMAAQAHTFDLAGLRLSPGQGHRLELQVPIEGLELGGESYEARPASVPVTLDVSKMTGGGYALKLALSATLVGPCMRCLKDAAPQVQVQAREVEVPGEGEELASPYVHDETLDVAAWAHDAFALAAPVKVLCKEDCAGLCPECAIDLNEAGPEHRHERAGDPRWAKLGELKLD